MGAVTVFAPMATSRVIDIDISTVASPFKVFILALEQLGSRNMWLA
jgi:hypothetical protein